MCVTVDGSMERRTTSCFGFRNHLVLVPHPCVLPGQAATVGAVPCISLVKRLKGGG